MVGKNNLRKDIGTRMAFPDDYQITDELCIKNHGIHQWSNTGHPLKHRCTVCHKVKWVHKNEDMRGASHQHQFKFSGGQS